MNSSVKQIWLNALRSGKYEQVRQALRDNGKFCCLGVLTDLFIIETNQEWEHHHNCSSFEDSSCVLPPSVQKWARLNEWPKVNGRSLAVLNDEGASFEEIADLIEEHL